jgi:uncharacterized protein
MEAQTPILHQCEECQHPVKDHHRYCGNCGAYLGSQEVKVNIFNNLSLRTVFAFYFLYLLICLTVKHTRWFNNYDQMFWIEMVLAVITLRFAWVNRRQIVPVLRFNNFRWQTITVVAILAMTASMIVSISMREVNLSFFGSEVHYYNAYKMYWFPTAIMIYSIAIMPAIFEELAFRGVLFNYCTHFLDERLVVAVTAFLFAIMHLSLLSLVWLLPFGFYIGHLRRKYNTLWYGVAFHFVFNLTACLVDLYKGGQLL